MSHQIPDPARWLADLMQVQHTVLWPAGDISDASETLAAAATSWTKAVADLAAWQLSALQEMAAPWTEALSGASVAAEPAKDKRFVGKAWSKDPRFDALARIYLAQTKQLHKALEAAPLDERGKAHWGFALRQLTDALSPANMLVTNPEALQLAMETGGASLFEGLRLFTEDLARGRIAMTDETAFEVGRNVGTTPGSVIYQNELFQLVQYSPTTDSVHRRPLVIVTPAKNKRNYWTLGRTGAPDAASGPARLDADPDNWFDAAESIPGSWWPAWITWLAAHGGRRVGRLSS
jgi:polyhydroxyalkanoate synthase